MLNDLQISVNYTASAGDHIAPNGMVIGEYQLENEAKGSRRDPRSSPGI